MFPLHILLYLHPGSSIFLVICVLLIKILRALGYASADLQGTLSSCASTFHDLFYLSDSMLLTGFKLAAHMIAHAVLLGSSAQMVYLTQIHPRFIAVCGGAVMVGGFTGQASVGPSRLPSCHGDKFTRFTKCYSFF